MNSLAVFSASCDWTSGVHGRFGASLSGPAHAHTVNDMVANGIYRAHNVSRAISSRDDMISLSKHKKQGTRQSKRERVIPAMEKDPAPITAPRGCLAGSMSVSIPVSCIICAVGQHNTWMANPN